MTTLVGPICFPGLAHHSSLQSRRSLGNAGSRRNPRAVGRSIPGMPVATSVADFLMCGCSWLGFPAGRGLSRRHFHRQQDSRQGRKPNSLRSEHSCVRHKVGGPVSRSQGSSRGFGACGWRTPKITGVSAKAAARRTWRKRRQGGLPRLFWIHGSFGPRGC